MFQLVIVYFVLASFSQNGLVNGQINGRGFPELSTLTPNGPPFGSGPSELMTPKPTPASPGTTTKPLQLSPAILIGQQMAAQGVPMNISDQIALSIITTPPPTLQQQQNLINPFAPLNLPIGTANVGVAGLSGLDESDPWMKARTLNDFVASGFYIPLWNATQEPIDAPNRKILVPVIKDTFKLLRDIITDSFSTHKLIFSAKVMALYSPKLTSLVLKHKFDEWRADIKHGDGFYKMIMQMMAQVLDDSKKHKYNKKQIDLNLLQQRQIQAVEYLENIVRESPVLENLDWRQTKQPNGQPAIVEAADIVAQMRAAGMNAAISLLETSVGLVKKIAAKEKTHEFGDLQPEARNAEPKLVHVQATGS